MGTLSGSRAGGFTHATPEKTRPARRATGSPVISARGQRLAAVLASKPAAPTAPVAYPMIVGAIPAPAAP